MDDTLAQLLCSRVRAGIFRVLFGLRSGELHLRELQRQTHLSLGTVRQDIGKLVKLGVLVCRKDGNRIYLSANKSNALFMDIRQLVLKTSGLVDVLRLALKKGNIGLAFVFGSIAAKKAGPESDVDFMVIGDISLRTLSGLLAGTGNILGREINPHVFSPAEFRKRVRDKDHFVSSVLSSPKIFVVGSEHDLETMV